MNDEIGDEAFWEAVADRNEHMRRIGTFADAMTRAQAARDEKENTR